MRKKALVLFGGVMALAIFMAGMVLSDMLAGDRDRLLHVEPSQYAPVVVFEQYGERCMNFVEIEGEGRQTCFELDDPDRMVFEYTRLMTAALFAKPDPASILVIGLGGGTLPTALHKLLPAATIDTVELDPAVVKVAQRYFGYQIGPRQRVYVEDGRAFIERAVQEGRRYDIVMLDAFDEDYIPPHLMTVEFLERVRELLSADGLVVANLFMQSSTYASESATYATVFGDFYQLRAGLEGNRVIIAAAGALPAPVVLERNATLLEERLRPFGIDATQTVEAFTVHHEPPGREQPLRDRSLNG